jgi:protein-L-isoaspartate O-methyltransferase
MTEAENEIAPYHARFIAMLDAEFKRFGEPDGLPAPLRDAVAATPRHRFVHRFRLGDDSPPLLDFDADPSAFLATVYSDQVLRHAGPAGEPLASSNSQPSYILWLLHLLDLRPGQHVLEIGSGSGWLAAIMARLVGSTGHITDQSRADLAAMGIENITISTQDGTQARFDQAPFDRVMITAGTWSPPATLLGVNAGLPRATGLDLELVPFEAEPPSSDHLWPDPRGGITLLWRLKADAHAWRELLG